MSDSDAQTDHSQLGELAGKLGLHEHLCLIYDTQEEQLAAALPYLRAGLERGEKCLYIVDETTASTVLGALREGGTDVDHYLRSGALTIVDKREVYLKTGRFEPDLVMRFWTDAVTEACADKFSGLRTLVAAEMTWALDETVDTRNLIEYESKLNHFVRDHGAVIVCQYNRSRFPPEVILGVLRTHPVVVYGGLVSKNPYYVPPDELLKPNQPALEVERLLKNILEREQDRQNLRRSEERWRSVFENSAIGVALTDLNGRFLAANPVYQKLVGYTEEELRAVSFLDITHEDYREANWALASELREGKRQQFQIEKKYRREDGSLIWVSNNVSLVPGSETVPRFIMALSEDITERKRAEEDLRASEEQFRRFAEHRRDIVSIISLDGRELVYLNPAFEEITGRRREEMLKRSDFSDIIHPEDRERALISMSKQADGSTEDPAEFRIVRPDGTIRWVRTRLFPIRNDKGVVYRIGGITHDFTRRKHAEESLCESEERFRTTFENAGIGMALVDRQGHPFRCNPALQQMLGYSEEELGNMVFTDFTHPDDIDLDWGLYSELVAGKRDRYDIEKRYFKKDGHLMWGRLIVSLVRDRDGGAGQYAVGMVEDITERKRAEEAIRASEERWRAFFSASPAGLAILDSDLRYLEINQTLARFNGLTVEQHLGKTVREAIPRVAPSVEPFLRRVLATGQPILNFEVSGETPGEPGATRHALVSFFRVAGPSASPACVGAVVEDITERKRAEQQIEQLRSQLELERDYLREELNESQAFGEILGRSPALQRVLSQIELVAPTEASVLILGESGTGKELVARAIHRLSPRSHRPLIKVNCGSIPRELFESEFFGHVKGAFTGALRDRAGRFELADGGTLFLDEVSEIPLELQSKLLRVLQEGEFEPVGEESTRRVNVRVIAATNRDLQSEVEAGRFRLDLFHRLAVFPLQIPPLRERREDIPILAAHFVEQVCSRSNLPRPRLRRGDLEALEQYDWPGNVRELQNVIERAVILARGGPLRFDPPAGSLTQEARPAIQTQRSTEDDAVLTEAEWRERERDNLRKALARAGGRISGPGGAAEILGVHPNTLTYRLKALGLKK